MAKKKKKKKKVTAAQQHQARIRRAFNKALLPLSVARLKKLLRWNHIGTDGANSRIDFADRLITQTTHTMRLGALQDDLLAGRTSLNVFTLVLEEDEELELPVAAFDRATAEPQIVEVGRVGDIVDGQVYILWALQVSEEHYIDPELELQTDGQAAIIHSFYDPVNRTLQVRTGARNAQKIAIALCELCDIDFDRQARRLAITTRDELHGFAEQIGGRITASTGELLEPNGFGEVAGKKHPNFEDLQGTAGYDEHVLTTVPIKCDIEFDIDDSTFKVGIAMVTRSFVFRNLADEFVMQYIYGQLLHFFDNQDD